MVPTSSVLLAGVFIPVDQLAVLPNFQQYSVFNLGPLADIDLSTTVVQQCFIVLSTTVVQQSHTVFVRGKSSSGGKLVVQVQIQICSRNIYQFCTSTTNLPSSLYLMANGGHTTITLYG
jgi:hypothetical protein